MKNQMTTAAALLQAQADFFAMEDFDEEVEESIADQLTEAIAILRHFEDDPKADIGDLKVARREVERLRIENIKQVSWKCAPRTEDEFPF